MTYLAITVSSSVLYPVACRKWSFFSVRPTLTPSILFGLVVTLLEPSCMTPSLISNSTSPSFCLPVGRGFRLFFSKRSECRCSSIFTLVWPFRLMSWVGSVFGAGAASRPAAATTPAATENRDRRTGDLRESYRDDRTGPGRPGTLASLRRRPESRHHGFRYNSSQCPPSW